MKVLYRIVNALLAAAMFPVIIFVDFIAFRLSTPLVDTVGLQESFSIKFIIDVITGKEAFWYEMIFKNGSGTFTWPVALNPIKGRLIAFAVCFVLIVLIALFIIIWSIFSNKRIPILAASIAGLIATIVMIACFNSAASLFVDGTINIVNVFSTNWIVSLLGNAVTTDGLILGGFHNGVLFLFIGLLVWTGAYYLVELGETKEEKAKI
ncbi:MAG: hypothetical protein E7547_03385 [Ruminococcaceae bacterium]|nr:hypothetical protein [Oscillospiraceae bacterium]